MQGSKRIDSSMYGILDRIQLDTVSFAKILKKPDEEILSKEDQYPTFLTTGTETVGLGNAISYGP